MFSYQFEDSVSLIMPFTPFLGKIREAVSFPRFFRSELLLQVDIVTYLFLLKPFRNSATGLQNACINNKNLKNCVKLCKKSRKKG